MALLLKIWIVRMIKWNNIKIVLLHWLTCPQVLRFSLPVFQTNRFPHVSCSSSNAPTGNIPVPYILIPVDFSFDNFTVLWGKSYIVIDHILTQRLTKLRVDINQLQPTSSITFNNILTCLVFALTIVNLLTFLFGRICSQLINHFNCLLFVYPQAKLPLNLFTFFSHVFTFNVVSIFPLYILIAALLLYLFFFYCSTQEVFELRCKKI